MESSGVATHPPLNSTTTTGKWTKFTHTDTSVWLFIPSDYTTDVFIKLHRTELRNYIDEEGSFYQPDKGDQEILGSWRQVYIAGQTRYMFVPDGIPTVSFMRSDCPDIYYTLCREEDNNNTY